MKISIDSSIFTKVPNYKLGVAIFSGMNNKGKVSPDIKIEPTAKTEIETWIEATRSLGIDPIKFPPANINISNRFTVDSKLPSVNPMVDLANIISVETGTPVGLHDLDSDPGDIEVRPGRVGDTYVPLNQIKAEDVVDPIVFASGNHVQTRNWTWRIAETSKVDQKSKNVVLFINTLSINHEDSLKILNVAVEKFLKIFGGKLVQKGIITDENPEFTAELKISDKRATMDKIDEVLTRGVENIYPNKKEFEKVLRSGKKITLYQGFDPTAPQLHIGHMVGLRKLRQFQDLGHHVIFLIGDFTGMIGDPTGKSSERKQLTREEVLINARNYKEQAGKVLRFDGINPAVIKYNSEWLAKMSAIEFLRLSHNLTYSQVIERDMFQKRIKEGGDVYMNEFLYPFMQAYDSVAMNVDLEIGGADQMFNMLMGRKLMRNILKKEKFVLTTPLLTDNQGNKIGKTEGNVIALTASPRDFYAMIMSLGDDVIVKCFEYLTDLPISEVGDIERKIAAGDNPMIFKKKLARTLTAMLNDENTAQKAEGEFESVVQKGETPPDILELKVNTIHTSPIELLVQNKLITSRSAAKRIVDQGGVELDGQTLTNPKLALKITSGMILKVGKRNFFKLII